jgi:hypothetical protein
MGLIEWFLSKRRRTESSKPPTGFRELFDANSPWAAREVDGMLMVSTRDAFDPPQVDPALPFPAQVDLADLFRTVTRVRVRAGGMWNGVAMSFPVVLESSDAGPNNLLGRCLAIDENPSSFTRCMCAGGPTLELFAGEEKTATIGIQHGRAIRWDRWRLDACLRDGRRLSRWLTAHGMLPDLLRTLNRNGFAFHDGLNDLGDAPLSIREQKRFLSDMRKQCLI